ncbi:MAG: hypothetical protein JOZ27_05525 [Caulobacteraceae bacterium]|nr:hypothetical protein [Caulobacteraceae bacterium]
MAKLVPARPNGLSAVLGNIQLRPNDTFKVTASNGVLSIHKRHPDGRVESLRLRARGSFRQTTQFDPREVTVSERRRLEAEMHKSGLSQSEIADLLGVSQPTVSLDLRKAKRKRVPNF